MERSTRPARRSCLFVLAAGMAILSLAACAVLWRAFGDRGLPVSTETVAPEASPQAPSAIPTTQAASTPTDLPFAPAIPVQSPGNQLFLPFVGKQAPAVTPDAPTPGGSQSSFLSVLPAAGDWVEATLASLSVEEKVGQLIISGVAGYEINNAACSHVQAVRPAGVTFQWDNVKDPEQLRQLTQALRACLSSTQAVPPFFTLAHEGEYVHRFISQVTIFPTSLGIAATGDAQLARQIGLAAGQELAYSGINMVLGPVADVLLEPNNQVIALRTFGGDPQVASRLVEAMTAGYVQAGVIPVLKHFPGHGGVAGDTHIQQVVDRSDLERIRSAYLPPFRAGLQAGASVVMLSHVAYPAITGTEQPATIAPAIPAFLRNELAFEGIILSDALDMKGLVSGSPGLEEVGLEAIQAGVDMLLLNDPRDARRVYDRLLSSAMSGGLSSLRLDEAVRRILQVKAKWGLHLGQNEPVEPDWQANYDLATRAGYQMVTRLRDREGLIPLPKVYRNILMVSPITEGGQETHSKFLDPALREAGFQVEHLHYINIPFRGARENGVRAALAEKAPAADLLLVLTWQAHLYRTARENEVQAELVQAAIWSGKPVLLVALNSPTDLLAFPDALSVLETFGTTDGALRALADILVGRWEPEGINPLPGLQ